MIGEKKLKDVKTSIRDAFARSGVDVNKWLDDQMAKLRLQQVEGGASVRTDYPAGYEQGHAQARPQIESRIPHENLLDEFL